MHKRKMRDSRRKLAMIPEEREGKEEAKESESDKNESLA